MTHPSDLHYQRRREILAKEIAEKQKPRGAQPCYCESPKHKCMTQPGAVCKRYGWTNSNTVPGSK